MFDKDRSTRWSPGRPQEGTEEVQLFFPLPISIEGLMLSPGNYSSDFPRGIRIEECGDSIALAEIPRWLGSIKQTDEGFPYFSRQSTVIIPLENRGPVHCLSIHQTARDAVYDWSIAELRIALSPGQMSASPSGEVTDSQPVLEEEPE